MMIATPKVAQAMCAATGDYYTWMLARRIYGSHSQVPQAAVCDMFSRHGLHG
jgi:phosphatidylinositol glycan class B